MTAEEVIDEIKALRPEEQAKVLDQMLAMAAVQEASCADDVRFDHAAEEVLDRHADLMRELAR